MVRTLLIVLALAGVACAAPAPMPKPPRPGPPPPPFVGEWSMRWKGCAYRVTFSPDGSYQCSGGYAGTWCLDPVSGTLHVEELSQTGSVLNWSVTFTGPAEGILDDWSVWRLDTLAGK